MNAPIQYSRGKSKFDNRPRQFEARGFEEFARIVLSDTSEAKGLTYVCAPMATGFHHDIEKYPNPDTYRIKTLAQSRQFLPFDLDAFADKETFPRLLEWLTGKYPFFAYTTSSSTDDAPRCRLVLAQNRATTPEEGEALGAVMQAEMEGAFGANAITFDKSVYHATQPLFTPVNGAKAISSFTGKPVDVDSVLKSGMPVTLPKSAPTPPSDADPVLTALSLLGEVKTLGVGKYAVPCPFESEHSSPRDDANDSSTVYYLPNHGGYATGNLHCLHAHCAHRTQADYKAKLGITEADPFELAVKRLSTLRDFEYDRVRKPEAKALGVLPRTLDAAVKEARAKEADKSNEMFPAVEPWHTPIDPTELLSEIARTIDRFVICEPETTTAATLWAVMTWVLDSVNTAPLAVITAPTKGCGKTVMLSVIGKMVRRSLPTSSITPAALFRTIEKWQPTMMIDEADAFMRGNEELRGVLNAGHTRVTAFVIRSVGDDHEPTRFNVWGAKALAGIGHLAPTLMDRAVILELRKKLSHETVQDLSRAPEEIFETLRRKLARFSEEYADTIRDAQPETTLFKRVRDNWNPLLAIASCAGEAWFERATQASLHISQKGNDAHAYGSDLLADIKEVFDARGVNKIFKADLLEALTLDDEKSWGTYNKGRPIEWVQVAKKLKGYGIKTKPIRIGSSTQRGFDLSQFEDAFERYLVSDTDTGNVTSNAEPQRDNEQRGTPKPAWALSCNAVTHVTRLEERYGKGYFTDLL
jgi:hypothetical protein